MITTMITTMTMTMTILLSMRAWMMMPKLKLKQLPHAVFGLGC